MQCLLGRRHCSNDNTTDSVCTLISAELCAWPSRWCRSDASKTVPCTRGLRLAETAAPAERRRDVEIHRHHRRRVRLQRPSRQHITDKYVVAMGEIEIEQGLTSHQIHYRSFGGRLLQVVWPNQQCQSTEGNQLIFQIRLESHQDHSNMLQ